MNYRITIVNSHDGLLHLPEQARKSSCKHGIHPRRTESHPGQKEQKHREEMKRDGGLTRAAQKNPKRASV